MKQIKNDSETEMSRYTTRPTVRHYRLENFKDNSSNWGTADIYKKL